MRNGIIKIFIDPVIMENFGPEVCWVWRLLLSGLGYCWAETNSNNEDCDLVYAINTTDHKKAKVRINADMQMWRQMSVMKVRDVFEANQLYFPLYDNQTMKKQIITVTADGIIVERDLIFDIFYLVTGQEEKYWPRDKHGIFDLSGNRIFIDHVAQKAPVSGMLDLLEKAFREFGFPFLPLPRWPLNKRAAVCLSHDVDYPEIKRLVEPLRIIQRLGYSGIKVAVDVIRGRRTHWHFSSWVQMEQEYGFRSAFYFVPVQGSLLLYALGRPDPFYDVKSLKFRKLFEYLTDEGCEIGLHASYLAFKSEHQFRLERDTLRRVTGQQIHGNRHHYWHLDPDDIESTLLIHDQIGLKYDTSLTHDRYPGWRRGLSWPFFPFHQKKKREIRTLQLQTTWMDAQLLDSNDNKYIDRYKALSNMADIAVTRGGLLNINVHDYVFDDILFPGWSETYRWNLNYLAERSDFWVATPVEITNHWINRYNIILESSHGLKKGM